MLDVAFAELTARTQNDLRTHEARLGMNQKPSRPATVAETVRAARLVVALRAQRRHAIVWYTSQPLVSTLRCHVRRLHLHGVSVCCQCRITASSASRALAGPG